MSSSIDTILDDLERKINDEYTALNSDDNDSFAYYNGQLDLITIIRYRLSL